MSSSREGAPTFVDGVGDLVKGTAIALLGGGGSMGGGEGGHCREGSRRGSGVSGVAQRAVWLC
jgi:hypothetical protein